LALDAELSCRRNCPWTRKRESRLKGRNFKMILFLADVRVNENRKILLCKTIGGGTEICEIKNKNTARSEDSDFAGDEGLGF
jgi:hypothetical protein